MSVSKGSTVLLAVVVLLLTFAAGALVGVVGGRAFFWSRIQSGGKRPVADFMVKRLDRSLDLTPQQEAQVTRNLHAHHERIGAVWSGLRPQLRREVDQTNAEIERVLTPEQRKKFSGLKMRLMPRERRGIRIKHE